jgi:cytochrome c oxidase subunit 3
MSVIGLVFVTIASIAAWWLVRQGILESPWLDEGAVAVAGGSRRIAPTAGKVGLGVFLAVVSCLFALLTAAFFMRMDSPDWVAPPAPRVLWLNTATLIASGMALRFAQFAADREELSRVRASAIAACVFAVAFLCGQLWAWRELSALGFFAAANPANAFFYLLTAVHALHLAGGIVALGRTSGRAWGEFDWRELRSSLQLCAIYWRFLLIVWLFMFAMLAGWANEFGVICRRVLS